MSDKISAVNQVAAVAKGNTVGFVFHFYSKEDFLFLQLIIYLRCLEVVCISS